MQSMYCRHLAVLLLLILAPTAYAADSAPAKPNAAWAAHVQKFLADHFAANPSSAVSAGKHEYDGQIDDYSEAGIKKDIDRLHAARKSTEAFKDADLNDRERFE